MLFLLFSFRGRINRGQYWFGALLVSFGSFLGQILIQILSAGSAATATTLAEKFAAYSSASALLLPLTAATLWASLAVQWKRFHDRGRPGWLSLVPLLVILMLFANVITDIVGGADLNVIIGNVLPYVWTIVLMGLAMFIDLGCLPSKDGPNKYGDPPGSPGARGPQSAPHAPGPSGLVNAHAAMERAIAQRDTKPAAPAGAAKPAPGFATLQPAAAAAPAGQPTFGRRAPR